MPMETVLVFQILSQSGSSISPAASASASLRDGCGRHRRRPAGPAPVPAARARGGGRRLLDLQVLVRQRVCEVEGQEGLVAHADAALDEQLQLPRLGQVELEVLRHDEQGDLAQGRRTLRREVAEAGVVAVAEADALAFLEQFDAIEDAAADIARSLERVGAVARDHDGLLVRLEPRLELLVAGIPEKAASDGGNAHWRKIQVDERCRLDRSSPGCWPPPGCRPWRRPR